MLGENNAIMVLQHLTTHPSGLQVSKACGQRIRRCTSTFKQPTRSDHFHASASTSNSGPSISIFTKSTRATPIRSIREGMLKVRTRREDPQYSEMILYPHSASPPYATSPSSFHAAPTSSSQRVPN